MTQGNDGSDLSDLKSRLGLNKGEQDEEQSDQQQDGQDPSAGGGDETTPQQRGSPQAGGPPDDDGFSEDAATRVAPHPEEQDFPPADVESDDGSPRSGGPQGGGGQGGGDSQALEPEPLDDSALDPVGGSGDSGRSSRGNQGPPGSAGPPGSSGPPPGASSGPPPGVDAQQGGGGPAAPGGRSQGGRAQPDEEDIDLDFDDDLDEGFDFSLSLVGLGVVVLVVGVAFGLIGMSSYKTRQLYNMQINQAQTVVSQIEPKVKKFQTVKSEIETMDADAFEPEKVKALAENTFQVDSSILGSDRLMLGASRTVGLTSFMVNMERLNKLVERHRRLSLDKERDQLEKIEQAGTTAEGEKKQFAIWFNFKHFMDKFDFKGFIDEGKTGGFTHQTGHFGTVSNFDNPKEGMVEFTLKKNGRVQKVPVQSVVPVNRGDLLTLEGENALQRYQQRVGELKHLIKKIGRSPESLLQQLNDLANREPPPLISL